MGKRIRVFAPATVANVACGFDILGFAVHSPGDEVLVSLSNTPGVRITRITGDDGRLPRKPDQNTAGLSVTKLLEATGTEHGIDIELNKKMPLGSGLGSSAASAVAALYATNKLLGDPFTPLELLPFAMESERLACGTAHADNAAPALLGGFVLIRSYHPLDVIPIPTPEDLYCTLLHPRIEVLTDDARKILRKNIRLQDAIVQWGNVAGLIAGLMQSDFELIGRSMQDVIIEPVRSLLIPGYEEIKNAALSAGALGCSISGSGPSLFALSISQTAAGNIAHAMQTACTQQGIDNETYVSAINPTGPVVLEE